MFENNVDTIAGMNKTAKSDKNLVLSFSLLMKLLEFAKEEAKSDVALHKVMEKLASFNDGVNPLKIDVYELLISGVNDGQEDEETESYEDLPCSSPMDCANAYVKGIELAKAGEAEPDSHEVGTIIKDMRNDGYGASNSEVCSLWDGYESVEPMKQGCFTEVDVSKYVNKPMTYNAQGELQFNHTEPTKMEFSCGDNSENEYPVVDCQGLDEETLRQIEEIISIGRM